MATRSVGIVMTPSEAHEAKGVVINRTIGSDKLVLLDPFLLLDHLTVASESAPVPGSGDESNETGFPRHPHRGIETLTYVFAGQMGHKDSLGNEETVSAGETQFMTAGAGIFHEEKPSPNAEGVHESVQLWLNLPANQKAKPAAYHAAHNSEVPEVKIGEATVRVVAGMFGGATGALRDIATNPTYLDVHLPAGSGVSIPVPDGDAAFAYVYKGEPAFGDEHTPTVAPNLAVFVESGDTVTATAGINGAKFVFVSAKPLNEPVLQYRSLVMSNVAQMKQALDDLQAGTFA
ncbi:MAG: pirin family protein [Armatimonadetes bacterium]|nr:pirin family protein [Armatimonadota bacterium]